MSLALHTALALYSHINPFLPHCLHLQWFTDYLSDLCEDEHLHRYLDIRVFLTNCDSAPDELASALLQLGLKTAGDKVTVRRPSQPQLNNLYHMTSYGVPDFTSLLDCEWVMCVHTLWSSSGCPACSSDATLECVCS